MPTFTKEESKILRKRLKQKGVSGMEARLRTISSLAQEASNHTDADFRSPALTNA